MTIQINGNKTAIDEDGMTISRLLETQSVPDPEMVSVQLNGEILERKDFVSKNLHEGDEVEFLYFMGGG